MKRVLIDKHGPDIGLADDHRFIAAQGLISGLWGCQMPIGDLTNVTLFDDFVGAVLNPEWAVLKGTDGAAANFALVAGASGVVQGTTGATSTTMAGSGIQIDSALNFKAQGALGAASSNNLEFDARVQTSAITGLCLFVGLTNQIAALQMPIQGSGAGNAFTANAADAVGFLFDTSMTTPSWWAVGVKGGVVAAGFNCGSGPVAAAYDQLHISVDQLGNANFWRTSNGVTGQAIQQPAASSLTLANAITPTVALTPVIAAFSRIAVSKNILGDYVMTSMDRI